MNTRCYRCGWSFSMSREALEEAAASDVGQKAHIIHCPRCRQTIRIPMDQILRALPAGWTPAAAADQAATATAAATIEAVAEQQTEALAELETADKTDLAPEAAAASDRSQRRHRHSSKTHSGDSAAVPAAKKSTHPN
jgi:hypothetical protein